MTRCVSEARKAEIALYKRHWCFLNRERLRIKRQHYKKANREWIRLKDHLYYLANRESKQLRNRRGYEKNRARVIKATKLWKRKNPEKVRFYWHKRLAIKRRASPEETRSVNVILSRIFNAKFLQCYWGLNGEKTCPYGRKNVPKSKRSLDHIVALSRGGSHIAANLCMACRVCNSRKSDKTPFEWAGHGEFHFLPKTSVELGGLGT